MPVEPSFLELTRVSTLVAVWVVVAVALLSILAIRRIERSQHGQRLVSRVMATILGLLCVAAGVALVSWMVGRS